MKPGERVLVTAASRHGATHEIAEAIASGLARRDVEAEARPIEGLTGLDGYDKNKDEVFNVIDYACDHRVDADPPGGDGPTFPSTFPVTAARGKK